MTLALSNLIRGLFFDGPANNGYGNGFAHKREPHVFSRKTLRSAKLILFVDDEPSLLSMRRLVFETLGYSVLTATCGEDALKVLATYPVDAVVLDYLMPGMDGEETARRIRKLRSDIPIILSTACLTVPERVLEVVTAAVGKGAKPEVLIEVLEQHHHAQSCL
jgi:CheY-like chemotaxis protein